MKSEVFLLQVNVALRPLHEYENKHVDIKPDQMQFLQLHNVLLKIRKMDTLCVIPLLGFCNHFGSSCSPYIVCNMQHCVVYLHRKKLMLINAYCFFSLNYQGS